MSAPGAGSEGRPPSELVAGRFQILRLLGTGGMGRVALAADTWRDGRRVALKLAPEDDASARRALEHEFLLLASLQHPYLVSAGEFGTCLQSRQAWFSMEHAAGPGLDDAAKDLAAPDIASLLARLARGLDFLHSRGWVHGDVKSDNVVVIAGADGQLQPRLLDFGLARRKGDAPESRGFSGTLTHAAPEVLAGRAADGRADLYALGVAAYRLFSGALPFEDRDPLALADAHGRRDPPPLASRGVALPRAASDLVDRLLAKDPEARPKDGAAVADALQRAFPEIGGETLDAALAWAVAPRLVAREDAEQAGVALLSRARDPREAGSRVLWLVGGEGQGKSRSLDLLAPRVQAARGIVLRGEPAGEPLSFLAAPLRDVVRLLGRDAPIVVARAGILATVVPELAPGKAAEPLPPDERLLAVVDAAWELVRAVATRPVVLLLDGLERCEPEDRRALELLARVVELDWARGRRVPFALAGSLDEAAAHEPSWAPVLALGRQAPLVPLDQSQLMLMLASMFPGLDGASALVEAVLREGGGRPRLLQDWCAELVRKRLLRRDARGFALDLADPEALAPPPGAAEQAAREVGTLPAPVRLLLAAAAEAPVPWDALALARAAGLRGPAAESALDVLERRRLVVVEATPSGRQVRAASERLRAAARADGDEGAALAARLLDDASAERLAAADKATLAERAGRTEPARALLADALAEAEQRGDPARAAALAGRLAALTTGRARRDALRRRAGALLDRDRLGEADGAAAEARAAGLDGPDEEALQLAVEGRSARRRGDLGRAADLLRRASEAAEAAGEETPFEAQVELARTLLALRDPAGSELAEALLRRAGSSPRERLTVRVLHSAQLLRSRENARALDVLSAARRDAASLGLELTEASCANNLGILALRSRELGAARRHFDRAARLRRRNGARGPLAGTLANLALVENARGRWREGARHARAAAEIQEDVGNRQGELLAVLNEAAAFLSAEEPARAGTALARASRLAEGLGALDPALECVLLQLRAEHGRQLGRLGDARALASRAAAVAEAGRDAAHLLEARALEVQLGAGLDAARALAEQVVAAPDPHAVPLHVSVVAARALAGTPGTWLAPWGGESAHDAASAVAVASSAVDAATAHAEGAPSDRAAAFLSLAAARALQGAAGAEVARLVRRAGEIAGEAAVPSLALEMEAAQAWLAWSSGERGEAERRLEAAVASLRRRAGELPAADRDAFLARPEHAACRAALLEARRLLLEDARSAGWEALAPKRAARRARGGAAAADDGPARREAARAKRRAERLAEILEISRGITALIPVDQLLARVLDSAMRFMDADRGFIVLGRAGETLRFAVAQDRDGRDVPRAGFAVSRSVLDEVLRTRQPVLSSDAREDARFVSKASVLALDLRSVLVAPLVASSEVVGAIYLDNLQASGVFGPEDRDLLGLLAAQAAVAVQNARLHEAELEKERIEQELSVARGIQQALLPRSLPEGGAFRLAAVMQPARELGGDWYDVVPGPSGSFTLTVGDVSGKGVGAALFMVMARTILRAELDAAEPLDRWLLAANAEIAAQLDDDKFLTLVALRAGGEGRLVRYSLAGHEPPIVYRDSDGVASAVAEGGLALGMLPSLAGRLEERALQLEPGDVVTCVSDGVTECKAPSGELFGRERLRAAVAAHAASGADELLAALLRELDAWRGGVERSDDVTIVVLEARKDGMGGAA